LYANVHTPLAQVTARHVVLHGSHAGSVQMAPLLGHAPPSAVLDSIASLLGQPFGAEPGPPPAPPSLDDDATAPPHAATAIVTIVIVAAEEIRRWHRTAPREALAGMAAMHEQVPRRYFASFRTFPSVKPGDVPRDVQ
jgi:hypothetical protein